MESLFPILIFCGFLAICFVPIGLVAWELLTGHSRSVATGRKTRVRFGLKSFFFITAAAGFLTLAWQTFAPPAATAITVGMFVGGPLLLLILEDLLVSKVSRHADSCPTPRETPKHASEGHWERTASLNFHLGSRSDKSPSTYRKTSRKWWAKIIPRMRLGPYGMWK